MAHVSPKGKGDNVMIAVKNGDSQEYIYQIPENHRVVYCGCIHIHGTITLIGRWSRFTGLCVADKEDTNNLDDYDPTTSTSIFSTCSQGG